MSGRVPAAERRAVWLFLTPALTLLGVCFLFPIVASVALSFTDFDIYGLARLDNVRMIGPRNYLGLAESPLFWRALRNTLYFTLVGAPLSTAAGLGAAILVSSRLVRFKGLFRSIYFVPFVTTLVAVALVWRYLYDPRYGLISYLLSIAGVSPIDWLGDPRWAMPALIILAVWKNFGYSMLIFMAGLQAIPRQLYEAARLDGAKGWHQFQHITLPMLGPTLLLVSLVTVMGFLQLFTESYVMTQGGPLRSTTSLTLLMYEEGFRWWRMGNAAALAVVLLLMTVIGMIALRAGRLKG